MRTASAVVAVAGREVRAAFGTPWGYGLTAGFLAVSGLLSVLALRGGEARLDAWFASLFVATGAVAPLLAMRTFADEERTGSLELLVTAPVGRGAIVAGKVLGVASLFCILVAGTVTCPLLLTRMGDPDAGPIITGYIGLVLVGIAFAAVGTAASAATANQLAAAASATGLLLAMWFAAGVVTGLGGPIAGAVRFLSPSTHVTGFLRGTLAADDAVYFLTLTLAGGAAATAILEARR